MSILGFASGMSQLGLIGVPELLPNKYRHIGIVLSDALLFPILICAPIIGRYAVRDPLSRNWTFIYWGSFVAMVLTFIAVFFLYKPPKHPRGVPWKVAMKGLDYVGALLVTGGVLLTLMGIVYTTYLPAKSALVLGPLVSHASNSERNRLLICYSALGSCFSLPLGFGRTCQMSPTSSALRQSFPITMAVHSLHPSSSVL
jgi:glucose-6-phosphate-specific signal transduction histidine kinase